MADGELAPIWKVTRFCCTSGYCIDCHRRGGPGIKHRARITHADKLTKPMADKMTANWQSYAAKTEKM
jgi:transcriptional regulator CtsR